MNTHREHLQCLWVWERGHVHLTRQPTPLRLLLGGQSTCPSVEERPRCFVVAAVDEVRSRPNLVVYDCYHTIPPVAQWLAIKEHQPSQATSLVVDVDCGAGHTMTRLESSLVAAQEFVTIHAHRATGM